MRNFPPIKTIVLLIATGILAACSRPSAQLQLAHSLPPTSAAGLSPTAVQLTDTPLPPTATPSLVVETAVSTTIPITSTYQIVNTYPHDPTAFTQGLVFENNQLYEGTGRYGQSSIRLTDLTTGNVLQKKDIPPDLFGEGIVVWKDKLYQITWKAGIGFIYDRHSFDLLGQFQYPGEGWGLTHDGQQLIMSDGTDVIRFLNPETLAENGRIRVFDKNGPIYKLNELEYVKGEIFANIWQTNLVARIHPETGQILGWIDLTGLLATSELSQPVDVLNGIAYDKEQDRLFVTGKLWPHIFEIKLIEETTP